MTQRERMEKGLIYDTCDPEIQELQRPYQEKLWAFNQLKPSEGEKKTAYMKEVFAECGDYCYIELPFRASWGGRNVHFGTGIYFNSNVMLIDDGQIYIGNRVLVGPNVVITTANHPQDPELRRYEMQFNRDVHIEENVWIGAGAIILPGVTIGKNSVIGAGSVVTRDIPENVLAVGTPCRIVRQIGARDHSLYYHLGERIDWDDLNEVIAAKRDHPKFH